jgi:hypothetical protein
LSRRLPDALPRREDEGLPVLALSKEPRIPLDELGAQSEPSPGTSRERPQARGCGRDAYLASQR